MCVGVSVWLGWSGIRVAGWSCASACNTDTTPTQPHRNSNTHRTKSNTTNVVIQQNSHKFLVMDILMSETCWAHKKWNKIANDIKLVFYSSTITMMHSPVNMRWWWFGWLKFLHHQDQAVQVESLHYVILIHVFPLFLSMIFLLNMKTKHAYEFTMLSWCVPLLSLQLLNQCLQNLLWTLGHWNQFWCHNS